DRFGSSPTGAQRDLCPSCLGVDHLREALTDNAWPNCAVLPLSLQSSCLAGFDHAPVKRSAFDTLGGPRKRTRKSLGLSLKVDQLTSELTQMKELLHTLQGGMGSGLATEPDPGPDLCSGVSASDDDAVSLAASVMLAGQRQIAGLWQPCRKFGLGHMPPV
ncbi:hypothetical protein GOODEAATRI_015366, partial [Goodea atripinnis]